MALRPSAAHIKGLFRTAKRGYAVQATVKKVTLDPSRPIGDVPLLFSKQGARLRALQQEISLREMDKSLVSLHTVLANGGEAGLANLETAQKIVASPALMAQLKKDTELSKKALVSAVAWLKDIRSVKDAQAAATKVDAATKSLLERTVAFNEIVPARETLGLNLTLSQKATVGDWWLAYAAAAQLRETNKTYSTLTSVSLSSDAEKALHVASLDRVRRQLIADARKSALANSGAMPAPLTILAGSEVATPAYNAAAVTASISAAVRLVEEAAAIAVNAHTIAEVMALLMKARNELRTVAATLRAEADIRQTVADEAFLESSWATLLSTAPQKSAVETAAEQIKAENAKANGTVVQEWDEVIKATLPSEHSAIEAALSKLADVVNKIPSALFDAELKRREPLSAFAALDQAYVRP